MLNDGGDSCEDSGGMFNAAPIKWENETLKPADK